MRRTVKRWQIVLVLVGFMLMTRIVLANDAKADLDHTLANLAQFDEFNFQSNLIQTETFAARVENIGRSTETQRLTLNGDVDGANALLELTSPSGERAALKMADGVVLERSADGEWLPSANSAGVMTMGGSPFTFLDTAKNVRYAESSALFPDQLIPDQANITRLAFDLDRAKFTQMLHEQMLDQLKAQGQYRAGVAYNIAEAYQQMDGQGELWIGADNFPVRQIIAAKLPQPDGNVIDVRITTDFNDWNESSTKIPFLSEMEFLTLPDIQVQAVSANLAVILIGFGSATLLLLYGRSRRFYITLAAILTVSFVGSPLFQVVQAARTAAFVEGMREDNEAAKPIEPSLPLKRHFAPNLDPTIYGNATANALTIATAQANTGALTGQDQDGDTLNDEIEIQRLGTNYRSIDSDSDGISDNYEAMGFVVTDTLGTTKTWYLDPLKLDSNGDGLPDNVECLVRVNIDLDGTFMTDANPPWDCPDTDGDAVPDVWDYDNDNDGVPDAQDSSPNYVGDGISHDASGFNFDLAGLTVDKPVEIEFQVAPTDPDHLYLANNVYDWPSGDTRGQFQRVRDTTLSSVGVTGDAARNGDVMIMPELEVIIPWNAANPTRGLPISDTVNINNLTITKSTPLTDFVDFSLLDHSKVTAYRDETTGDVFLYLSLSDIQDSIGDRPVAWRGQMPYLPKLTTGSGDHSVRLAWSVLGLFDKCDPAQAPAGTSAATFCSPSNLANWTQEMQLMHRYYEPFKLTGFTISENGGMNTALIADKTALTTAYPTNLWHVTNGLMETYLRPTTLANGSRFDVAEIERRFKNNSSATETERWGLANTAMDVRRFAETNHTKALSALISTRTKTFLNDTYGTPADGERVTIGFAQDTTSRALNLSGGLPTEIGFSGNKLSVDLSSAETQTVASLSWRPFKYTTANGWEREIDLDAHVTQLKADITPLLTDNTLDTLFTGTITNHAQARSGALAMAAAHYVTLYVGLNTGVNYDGDILQAAVNNDAPYQLSLNPSPLATVIQDAATFLYSAAIELTVISLDGQTISLSGFAPSPDLAAFMTEYGEYVNIQEALSNDTTYSMRRGAVKFVVGTIIYLYQVASRTYDLSNSAAGLRFQSFYAVGMLTGAALLIAVSIESQKGTLSAQGQKVMTIIANTLFIASQPLEVMRIAQLAGHLKSAKEGLTLAKSIASATKRAATLARSLAVVRVISTVFRVIASLGLALDILVEVAFFLYTVISNNFKPGDVGWHVALARFVSAVIVSFVLAVAGVVSMGLILASNPVGWAILGMLILLAIVDAVMAIVCAETGADAASLLCNGVTGTVVNEMTKFFFKHTPLVQLNHSNRVQLDMSPMRLQQPEKGFTLGNAILTTFSITHTLYPERLDNQWTFDKPTDAKLGPFSDQWTRRSSVEYHMSADPNQTFPNNLVVTDQPQSAWNVITTGTNPGISNYVVDYHLQQAFTFPTTRVLTTTGINKSFSYYLTENIAIPLANCHNLLVGYGCEFKNHPDDTRFSNKIDMADLYVFDVLPADVSGFGALSGSRNANGAVGYRQAWESTFPVLKDADGDGLISAWHGGADPDDSSADLDKDGLLDAYELRNGFDPRQADGDKDGLTDYWEVFYKTNPFSADTDSDGLLDGEEVFHPASYPGSPQNTAASWTGGWNVVYQYDANGAQQTLVTSNPMTDNSDGDKNGDHYEFIYKFNPRAPYSVEPLAIKSLGGNGSNGYDFAAQPNTNFGYTVVVTSNLDTTLRSRGLVEGELPIDNVQQTQTFDLLGGDTLTMTGSLFVDPAVYTATHDTAFVLRAGAHTSDVNATPPTNQIAQLLPLNTPLTQNSTTGFYHTPDRSGNNNNPYCGSNAIVQYCPDFSGGYAQFDSNDYLSRNMPLTGDFAMSYWILPSPSTHAEARYFDNFGWGTDLQNYYDLISLGISANGKTVFADVLDGGTCSSAVETRITPNIQLVSGQWNHVVYNYDGANVTIFINGQAGVVRPNVAMCADPVDGLMGGGRYVGVPGYPGGFRDVTAYDRALTTIEVEREATGGYRNVDLPFDEPPASSKFYDGRTNALAAQCLGNCPESGRPSVSNQGLYVPNSVGAIHVEKPGLLKLEGKAALHGLNNGGSFTVMAWVNGETWAGERKAITLADGEFGRSTSRFSVIDGHPAMTYFSAGYINRYDFTATNTTLQTNRWYHLAWQFDTLAQKIRLYVDGVLVSEQAAASFPVDGNLDLLIGGHGYWYQPHLSYRNIQGLLDHVVVVGRSINSAEIQSIMNESPLFNLHLDEDLNAGTFTNSSIAPVTATCTNCPTAGADGQMREAPVFADGDSIALNGLSNLGDHALTFWVRPTIAKTTAQTLVQHGDFLVELSADNKLHYCTNSNGYVSGGTLRRNAWNHVAIVRVNNAATVYINGAPDNTNPPFGAICATGTSQIGGNFDGQFDEFALYNSPLTALEISSLHDYQSRWFDVKIRPTLLVDGEAPSVEIHVPPFISNAAGQQLLVSVSDSGAGVGHVGAGMNSPAFLDPNNFTNAPLSKDGGYVVGFGSIPLQEGFTYRLQIYATDNLLNTGVTEKQFQVDATPPVATLTTGGSVIHAVSSITLNGTISDALSGVVTDTVTVHFAGKVVVATVTGDQWQAVVPLDAPPYGTYGVTVTAQDAVGNAMSSNVGSVQLHGTDPTVGLLLATDVISGANTTIQGFASTIPYPIAPLVHLPFDDSAFADAAPFDRLPTCTSCPTTGATGKHGNAATFAVGNHLQYTDTITSATSTLMLWMQPTWSTNVNGFDPIVLTSDQTQVRIADNLQSIKIGAHTIPFNMTTNQWTHLALQNDGANIRVYRNGVQAGILTDTLKAGLPLTIGAAAQGFSGLLDDVIVVNDALAPSEIYNIANPLSGAISKVEVSLWHPTTTNATWKTATLGTSSSNYTGWNYTITEQIEGPYRINLRVTDSNGLTRTVGSNWTGVIDTVAPRVSLAASNAGNGQSVVDCSADDLLLDSTTWQCTVTGTPNTVYEQAVWYTRHITPSQQAIRLSNSGTIANQRVTVTACDNVGQCSSDTLDLLANAQIGDVPEIGDYQLVYKLTPPSANAYTGQPPYEIDNAAQVGAFDRVAYWLELENGNERQWVYVSMDAFTNSAAATGVPIANTFEQNVTNLNVLSNVAGVTTGGPFATGNIEFWPSGYNHTANSGIGGNSTHADFDDTPTTCCYGSMQVHRYDVQQTLFGWNRWAVDGGNDDIGIGTSSAADSDWTYAQNSGDWTTRTLYVLVRPISAATNDSYNFIPGVPLTIDAASGVLANDGGGLTASLVTSPTNGTVTLNADGSFAFDGAASGNETFSYRVSDGHYLSKVATVTLVKSADATCLVETTGDGVTDHHSTDATALRTAVANAAAGSTIKVAGTCAGTNAARGQVLTIDKALTLAGGYQAGQWLATPTPATVKATLDAQNNGIVLSVANNAHVTVSGLHMLNGTWTGSSWPDDYKTGTLKNHGHLTLSDSIVSDSSSQSGAGGIYNTGWLTATNVTVENNTGGTSGVLNYRGKLWFEYGLISGNFGGGIYNDTDYDTVNIAVATVRGTVIRNNSVRGAVENRAGSYLTVEQSAIINNETNYGAGGISNRGVMTMTNSTVSGNRTLANSFGTPTSGASGVVNLAVATIRYSTIVSNTAPNGVDFYGFHYEYQDPPQAGKYETTLEGVVIAHNGNGDCRGFYWEPGFVKNETFAPAGSNNFGGGATCTASNFTIGDPLLGSLNNATSNFALYQTHKPQSGSPLIGAAGNCGLTDQRGIVRDATCDIGAHEVSMVTADVVCGSAEIIHTNATQNATLTIPAGAVDSCQQVTFTPDVTPTGVAPVAWQFMGKSFNLDAWQNGVRQANPTFAQPLQLTLNYTNAELGGLNEQWVSLYFYDTASGQWVDAATTCSPNSTYVRDAANNTLTINICHFTEFVLAAPESPTAIELDWFDATVEGDDVVVAWETSAEINHAGFNIYRRAAGSREGWVLVNNQLIASRGSQGQGAVYEFTEQNVPIGEWEYLLEDVELNGSVTQHNAQVVMVNVGVPTAVKLVSVEVSTGWTHLLPMLFGLFMFIALHKRATMPPTPVSHTKDIV